jgi:hypothetical protein
LEVEWLLALLTTAVAKTIPAKKIIAETRIMQPLLKL